MSRRWPWCSGFGGFAILIDPQIPADFSRICCMEALADALQHNTTLTYLDLVVNQIGDKGVEARVLQFSISFSLVGRTAGGARRPWRKPWRSTASSPWSTSGLITLETLVLRPFVFFGRELLEFWLSDIIRLISDCLFLQALVEMLKVNTTLRSLRFGKKRIYDSVGA